MNGFTAPYTTTNLWAGAYVPTNYYNGVPGLVDFSFDPPPVSSFGMATTIDWNFGDNNSQSGPENREYDVTHPYACSGSYPASATVTAGASSPQRTVQVIVPPPYQLGGTTSDGTTSTAPNVPITFNVSAPGPERCRRDLGFRRRHTANRRNTNNLEHTVTHAFTNDRRLPRQGLGSRASSSCPQLTYTDNIYVGQSTDWVTLPTFISHDTT